MNALIPNNTNLRQAKEYYRKSHAPVSSAERAQICQLLTEGKGTRDVALEVSRSAETVRRVKKSNGGMNPIEAVEEEDFVEGVQPAPVTEEELWRGSACSGELCRKAQQSILGCESGFYRAVCPGD